MEKQQLQEKETSWLLVCTKPVARGSCLEAMKVSVVSKATAIFCHPGKAQPLSSCEQDTNNGSKAENKAHTKRHVLPQLLCYWFLTFHAATSAC